MIDKEEELPITRQCALLDLCRSGVYYQAAPVSAKDLELMRQIDEIHIPGRFTAAATFAMSFGAGAMTWGETECDG